MVPETPVTSPRRGGAPTFSDSTTMRSPTFTNVASCSLSLAEDYPTSIGLRAEESRPKRRSVPCLADGISSISSRRHRAGVERAVTYSIDPFSVVKWEGRPLPADCRHARARDPPEPSGERHRLR